MSRKKQQNMLNSSEQSAKRLRNNNHIIQECNFGTRNQNKNTLIRTQLQSKNKQRSQLQTRSTQRFVKSSNCTRYEGSLFARNNQDKQSHVKLAVICQLKKTNYQLMRHQSNQNMEKIHELQQKNLVQNKLRRFRVIKSRNAGRLRKQQKESSRNKQNTLTQRKQYFKPVQVIGYLQGTIENMRSELIRKQEAALQKFEQQLSFRHYLMTQILNGTKQNDIKY